MNKIPPPFVSLIVGSAMWLITNLLSFLTIPIPAADLLGGIIAAIGGVVSLLAMISFYKNKTTINSITVDAAATVVSTGVYAISRNPMYLGLLLVLAGWWFHESNLAALAGLPVFVLYINRFQIIPEEEAMEKQYGEMYRTYKTKTRRWI